MTAGPRGLLVCDDLFFGTKVTGTARALGLRVDEVGTGEALAAAVGVDRPSLVLIDLSVAGPVAALTGVLPEGDERPYVVAFGSHVDTDRLREAREVGCDEVLPRSRFTAELPELLRARL